MINENTVLILGAGSSVECGFPSGNKLLRRIYEFTNGDTQGLHSLNQGIEKVVLANKQLIWRLLDIGEEKKEDGSLYGIEDIEKFSNALWDAQPRSIDEFIFDRKEFSLIAKICILYCLSECESDKSLKPTISDKDEYLYPNLEWYKYLWHQLTEGIDGDLDEFKKNKLEIITFNYDRSLEEFLFRSISAKFGLPDWDAIEVLEEAISIKHVYGDLGVTYYQFNHSQDESKRKNAIWIENSPQLMPYSPYEMKVLFRLWGKPGEYGAIEEDLKDLRFIRKSDQCNLAKVVVERAKRIKTYNESSGNELTQSFKETIGEASKIVFIGFGFHKQNLKALGFEPKLMSYRQRIYGTAYGFSSQELEEKIQLVRKSVDLPSSSIKTIHFYNQWQGLGSENSIIRSFFRHVEGAHLV